MKPGEFVGADGEVIFHAEDCCVAMGVAVLDRFVGGAAAVIVERDGDGGYTVTDQVEFDQICRANSAAVEEMMAGRVEVMALKADIERLQATLAAKEAAQRANEDAMSAEIARLQGQSFRWEAMYAGMAAERDGYWEEREARTERLRVVRDVVGDFIRRGENQRTWRRLVVALAALDEEVGE
jgi:hypothetical protein